MDKVIQYFKGDELAARVWLNKYALKDSEGNIYEETPDDMHRRIAKEIARVEKKYSNPMTEEEIFELIRDFKYIIPQGSPMAGIGNNFQTASLSNCFVIGSSKDSDSYGGIMKTDEEQVQLMKRRGGVGHDLSNIRPKGSAVKNSALTSTGIVPFMERYSNSTREVAQDGRRGALMLSVSINHPDAGDFIDAKMEQGKVTGANVSVRIDDEFMRAVQSDSEYVQKYPIFSDNPKHTKTIQAKEIWNKIIHNAWKSAEPGVLFWDTIKRESIPDCYADLGFETVSTNPCWSGDTLVATVNGAKTFKELAEDGRDILVYAMDTKTNKVVTRMMRNPRKTAENQKVLKLVVDKVSNNSENTESGTSRDTKIEMVLTPNHNLYIYDENGEVVKIQAKDLKTGMRFVSLSTKDLANEKVGELKHTVAFVEELEETTDVYNGTVDEFHNYYVLDQEPIDGNTQTGILSANCGEIPLCPYDSCRLLAINLYSYVENPFTPQAKFNFELFKEHAEKAQRIMDDIIDLEEEKIEAILAKIESDPESDEIKNTERLLWEKIKKKTLQGRRTGVGITAEGDMIAALGLTYGTDEATAFSTEVHKNMALACYRSSVNLAKERGAFEIYDSEREKNNPFILRLKEADEKLYQDMVKHGRRNIALLTIAPTGSTSLMAQTSSGIEPVFLPVYKRRRKVNPNDKNVRVDFVDEVGDSWEEYTVFHHHFKTWMEVNGIDTEKNYTQEELDEIVKQSPYYKATSNDVNWLNKVKLQGSVQKWVDHSISVTVNLPSDTTEELVNEIYITAWESGCKGITIYRDGSRSGVLVSQSQDKELVTFNENHAPKRPKSLACKVVRFNNNYEKWVAFVGLMDNKPYEIFTGKLENVELPNSIDFGEIVKVRGEDKRYDFVYDGGVIEGISRVSSTDYWNYGKLISSMLRHGMPLPYVVDTINSLNWDSDLINTWKAGVVRALRRFIKDGKAVGFVCLSCESDQVVFEEGCLSCKSCGSSACG